MKRLQFSMTTVLLILLAVAAYAQTNGQPERFTANAVSISPEYGTGQRIVEMNRPVVAEFRARTTGHRAPGQGVGRAAQAAAEEQASRTYPHTRLARVRPSLRATNPAA